MALESSLKYGTTAAHRTCSQSTPSLQHWLDPLVLALAAPLALFPERFPREAIAIGLALLALPYAVRAFTSGRPSAPSPANWIVLFLVAVVLPLNIRQHPYFWQLGWPELVRLLWGLAACLALVNWCNPPLRPRRSSRGLQHAQRILDRRVLLATLGYLALGIAFAGVGLLVMNANSKIPFFSQWVDQIPSLSPARLGRATGFNPNRVAGVAVLFLPLTTALLLAPPFGLRGPGRLLVKLAFLAATLFFAGVLALTQSRAGLLAGGVSVFVVLLLAGRRAWFPLALCGLTLFALLDIVGPSRLVDAAYVQGSATTSQEATSTDRTLVDRILADRNVAGRLMLWQRALHGIQDQPLTGMGLAAFQQIATEPYPMQGWRPDPDLGHAHNLFLQTGLDLGIPGLVAFTLLVLLAGLALLRMLRNTEGGSPARFWTVGMLGVWLAFLLFSLLDATTLGARPAITYWVMLGLCIGMGEQLTLYRTLQRHYQHHEQHHEPHHNQSQTVSLDKQAEHL